MSRLFKEKTSKFGSLVSLTGMTAMFVVFWMAVPEFIISPVGRTFAVVWALTAIVIFIAHAKRMTIERKKYIAPRFEAVKKNMRTQKSVRNANRMMRDQ
ncbi:hypothetical protein SDC9_27484 [bioreactor metagenome]|uniref:Uncharacterized protein n=1 Tax=bioreactor metagenome TaxID=1076179 RepID=A0A644UR73_9ZZZZ|nr:hypothetical protein [Negativicutes bacterium]